MTFVHFKKKLMITMEDICREFYLENRDTIRIKNERIAVKNLMKIIDATLAISNQKGFNAMSTRDLSAQTGLSMGALYSYFSSKEELLALIHGQGQKFIKRILIEQTGKETRPRERLHAVIRTHLYLSETMGHWFYFFFMETKNLDKKNRSVPIESEQSTEKIITDILDDGRKNKVFQIDDILLTGSAIKAIMQDWYLKRWKYRQRKVSVEEYAGFLIRFTESFIMPGAGRRGGNNDKKR